MSNLPSYLQQYQAPDIGQSLAATLGSSMPAHVAIGENRFVFVDSASNKTPVATFDPKLGVYLDAVIIDANEALSRIYYDGPYDQKAEGKRPVCYSDNGIGPSIGAASPQAQSCQPDPTGTFGCRWAVWGSAINANGNKVPACTAKQKLALLPVGMNSLFMLAVPGGSHGALREYQAHCKGHNIRMPDVVTRIWFTSQGVLGFSAVSYIDEPTAVLRQAAYAEKKTDVLVGRGDMPRPAGSPVPQLPVGVNPALGAPYGGGQQLLPGQDPYAGFAQQEQKRTPVPFNQGNPAPAQSAAPAAGPGWPQTNAAPTAATTPPSEQPAGRRKRRTQAEITADSAAARPVPGSQQASFPVNPPAGQTDMGFGIATGQPASANPELAQALDSFFTS